MARYFAEIVGGVVDRVVVGSDSDTTTTIGTLLGGTWIETASPDRYGSARLGTASSLVQPPILSSGLTLWTASPTKIIDTATYAAWPYGNLHYDSSRSKLWFTYMEAADHVTGESIIKFATINTTTDAVSTPTTIIDDATYRVLVHGACVAPNNDYLLFVLYRDTTTGATVEARVWRSTDGGSNWSDEGDMVNGSAVSVGCDTPHGVFVTSAGTILVSDLTDITPNIYRSTDNGNTWSAAISISNSVTGTEPLEPAFWQHPTSGRIVALYRAGQSGSQPNPLFTYSDDDGATWAAMSEAGDWWLQYSNPAAFVYHSDADIVEAYFGCRVYNSVVARMFRTAATPDDAANLTFGGMDLLYGGTSTNNDFGYPAAARVGSKVYLLWYDGSDTDTDIWMAVGTRS